MKANPIAAMNEYISWTLTNKHYELALTKKFEYSFMERFWIKFSKLTGKKLYITHYIHTAKTGPSWFRSYIVDDYSRVSPFRGVVEYSARQMFFRGYYNEVEIFDHNKEYIAKLYRPVTK